MTAYELQTVVPGVHVVDAPQRFLGLEMGARMTVLALEEGLLVHSPVGLPPDALAHLGTPRWVIAPNLFHHLHVGPWLATGLQTWASPGLPDKRPDLAFHGVVQNEACPFSDDVAWMPLSCFAMSNEVVVLHRPSRTLIVTDLLFNMTESAPWATRAAMRCIGGYPGPSTTWLERFGMQRQVARRELSAIDAWDFDRLIMAHGEVIETGGKAALRKAFSWLA